jgi:hypothetical protein
MNRCRLDVGPRNDDTVHVDASSFWQLSIFSKTNECNFSHLLARYQKFASRTKQTLSNSKFSVRQIPISGYLGSERRRLSLSPAFGTVPFIPLAYIKEVKHVRMASQPKLEPQCVKFGNFRKLGYTLLSSSSSRSRITFQRETANTMPGPGCRLTRHRSPLEHSIYCPQSRRMNILRYIESMSTELTRSRPVSGGPLRNGSKSSGVRVKGRSRGCDPTSPTDYPCEND